MNPSEQKSTYRKKIECESIKIRRLDLKRRFFVKYDCCFEKR